MLRVAFILKPVAKEYNINILPNNIKKLHDHIHIHQNNCDTKGYLMPKLTLQLTQILYN